MDTESNSAAFHSRVRYAECTAHGDLALAGYINFFSEAAARALGERGVDLRAITARAGALREAAYQVDIQASPAYDDEVDVEVRLHALDDRSFTLSCQLRATRGGKALAGGSIRYEARSSSSGGPCSLPPDLRQRLQGWAERQMDSA